MNNASMTLHPLTVGQFYGTPKPRGEGFHVMGLSLERAEVLCSYANLGPDEVQGWKDTPITAGLGAIMELGVLCLKDGISSGDAPYDIRAGHPGEQTPPPARLPADHFHSP